MGVANYEKGTDLELSCREVYEDYLIFTYKLFNGLKNSNYAEKLTARGLATILSEREVIKSENESIKPAIIKINFQHILFDKNGSLDDATFKQIQDIEYVLSYYTLILKGWWQDFTSKLFE